MDEVLNRMLSLIPKKPNGDFVHGGKKEFCEKIGAPTNIISSWENGSVKSYTNYVGAVASAYGVSVDWLLHGIPDEDDTLQAICAEERALLHSYRTMNDEQKKLMQTFIRGLKND